MSKPLDTRPARTDLTDRELTHAIGGLLGGLSGMCDLDTLRNAVRWWADSDEAWLMLAYQKETLAKTTAELTGTCHYCASRNVSGRELHKHGPGKCTASKVNE